MTDKEEKKIPLVECFGPTVQGEGAVIGQQTYFLRFGLCDYKCTMCDSMHAVDPLQVKVNAQWLTQEQIFAEFEEHRSKLQHSTRWVTFSGGNPCIHDLSRLVELLVANGFEISVETQGTFCPPWLEYCSMVCVSPKGPGMGEDCDIAKLDLWMQTMWQHPGLYMKVVVFDQRDIEFASMMWERYVGGQAIRPTQFFLSQGNPHPPGSENPIPMEYQNENDNLVRTLRQQYLSTLEDIQKDPNLCEAKFLPQMHVWLWGNKQGV